MTSSEVSTATPFNMIIVGMTACGKTNYLLEMLEKEYKGYFDYIFLICPILEWNKTYEKWKYDKDEDYIAIPCDQDDVEFYLKYVVNYAVETNSLIILDDCASGKCVKNRTSELVKLAFSARHFNLSTIVITQQLTSITKPYRENISKLVTFYNPNRKDMNELIEEYLDVGDKAETNKIKDTLKNKKYSRSEISLRHPYGYRIE